MLLNTVTPLDDFPISAVLESLRRVTNDLINIGSGAATEVLQQYQQWSTVAAESLGFVITSKNTEQLILTRRHWVLLSLPVTGNDPVVHDLIRAERTDRLRVLNGVIRELEALEKAWSCVSAKVLAADTNVYLHHERYFDEIDWKKLADSDEVRLLIPIAVVRELDTHKRSNRQVTVSDTNKQQIRTRARVTSRRLRELFEAPPWIAPLAPGVEAELLLDSLDHQTLNDADSEIIERVLAAKQLTRRPVAVVTGDAGIQFSARTAGLDVIPLLESM